MSKQIDRSALIEELFPNGEWDGDRYLTYSPFREDNNPGGAFVIFREGNWIDRSAVEKSRDKGSIIELIMAVRGVERKEARKQSLGAPIEDDIEYTYYDKDGKPTLAVIRQNCEYGKDIKKGYYTQNGSFKWGQHPGYKSYGSKPLYRLPSIAAHPEKPVLVVEGEKCAEAIQSREYIVTCWEGGSGAQRYTDWTPLQGRDVILWPDNDEAGKNAAIEINTELSGNARMVNIDQLEEGEDVADLVERGIDPLPYIKEAKRIEASTDIYSVPMPLSKWRHLTGKEMDRPRATLENFRAMLNHYGIVLRENLMSHKTEVEFTKTPGEMFSESAKRNNAAEGFITSIAHLNDFPVQSIGIYITTEAQRNAYHPVIEAIESVGWDGTDRLQDVCDLFVQQDGFSRELKEVLIRKWLISCVAALYETPYRGRGVLTLQGPQSIGKTSVLASLFDGDWFEEGLSLDPRNKDSIEVAISKWVAELGELEGVFRKADIASLKSFLTKQYDSVRLPYERRKEDYPRRTVFCATVNTERFLNDPTGSTRFWVIPVKDVHYQHDIDIYQVWAQILTLYRTYRNAEVDNVWWLSQEEENELSEASRPHTEINEMEELFEACYYGEIGGSLVDDPEARMSVTQVMRACGKSGSLKRNEISQMEQALKNKGAIKAPDSSKNYKWALDPESFKGAGVDTGGF